MNKFTNIFEQYIKNIKHENRYRIFNYLQKNAKSAPYAYNYNSCSHVNVWCSNDYLNMSHNPRVINKMINTTLYEGVGSGGTRNITGSHKHIDDLEKLVSQYTQKESALTFTCGYIANQCTLQTLGKSIIPNCMFFSDQFNHASIIDGIRSSNAPYKIYNHCDIDHLELLLKNTDKSMNKIIVFESIYSMNGSFSPIKKICELAKKYDALTYCDEIHSFGLYGKDGSGLCTGQNVDILMGGFSKAIGTMGGFIASNNDIIDCIRSSGPSFIFTTSLPPGICNATNESIKLIAEKKNTRSVFFQNVNNVRNALDSILPNKYKIISPKGSHILPILIKCPIKTNEIAFMMLKKGHYIQPINYPTVPRGTERLRITPTYMHTDWNSFIKSFQKIISKIN